ncbi:extracellular solute-binding protein [Kineococcus sp. TBRC 1896]|uniref:Extracellular solute-binding protein n=1 Tax=Kineococcus mangrovi TaxID=1660183 RepID=A0ABV4HWM5_9ACTN
MTTRRHALRTFGAVALGTGVLGTVGACGSGSDASGGTADGPVTLVLSNSQWLDALRGEKLWAAVKKFEDSHPDITLEQEAIASADYTSKITTEMGAGQGPDIVIAQEALFYQLADAGLLVEVDDEVTDGVELNTTADNGVLDDVRYGIAWQRAVYAMIYDKTLVDRAGAAVPTTVEELIASAQGVQAATGAVGFTGRHLIADFSGWMMDFQNWAYGHGVEWVDADGELTIDTPEAAAAFAAFKSVYDAAVMPIGDDMPTQRNRFKEGQVGFSIDNSGGTLNIGNGGALQAAELYSAPLPFQNPGAHQQIYLGISTHSEHAAAANTFLTWLLSEEGQQSLRLASGPDALATDVPVDPDFAAANPWAPTFADLAANSRSTLIPGYEASTDQIMRPVMEALERVLVSGADPATELAVAQSEVDALNLS